MIVRHEGKDITQIVTKVKWSGDIKQAARVMEFSIVVSPTDYYLPRVNIQREDMVRLLTDEGIELFRGHVFSKEKKSSGTEMTITAYDKLVYLTKSKGTYNIKNMTPQDVTKKIASDFNIQTGELEAGSPLSRIFDAENLYTVIMTAYTIESSKTNKQFMLKMIEDKLNVVLKGSYTTKFLLDAEVNVTDASYSETIENSVNRVKIYNNQGDWTGQVIIGGFKGFLQDIYKQEEGVDAQTAAKGLLRDIERTASIEALGNTECITGHAVIVKEGFTGLNGLFYIDSDTHTWENGMYDMGKEKHKMSLGLSYINLMDSQFGGQDEEKIEVNEVSSGNAVVGGAVTGTGKQRVWNFLKSKGFTDQAAAGIMGNLQQESGIDPTKYQYGGGPGRGLMQWEQGSDRFRNLQALARQRGTDWKNLDTQLEFFWKEFNSERTAISKLRRVYNMTPTQLMKLTDVSKAMRIFEDCYERAGKPNYPRREKYARDFYNKYKGTSSVIAGTSSIIQGVSGTGKVGDLIAAARTFLGFRYDQGNRFGSRSADCSSLIERAMIKAGITTQRRDLTTRSIHSDNRFYKVSKSQLKPGDVLWQSGHVGLYIGDNTLIEASYSAQRVKYAKLGNRFTYAYRIRGL